MVTQWLAQQQTAIAIQLAFGRMAEQQPLQAALYGVHAGEHLELALYLFPFVQGVKQQAGMSTIYGADQLALAFVAQPITVLGRNCQSPFAVQADGVSTTQQIAVPENELRGQIAR